MPNAQRRGFKSASYFIGGLYEINYELFVYIVIPYQNMVCSFLQYGEFRKEQKKISAEKTDKY